METKDKRYCLCGKSYGKCKSFALEKIPKPEYDKNAVEIRFLCTICGDIYPTLDENVKKISYDHENLYCFTCEHYIDLNRDKFIKSRKAKYKI